MMKERTKERIEKLGLELFGTANVDETIKAFEAFFILLDSPAKCIDAGIDASHRNEILEMMNRNQSQGLHHQLTDKEREKVLNYVIQ